MTLDDLVRDGLVRADAPMAPLTTYKFGGPARWFAEVEDTRRLITVLEARVASGDPPLLVLGRGSNVVVADEGFDGLILRLAGEFQAITIDRNGVVSAGAAVSLPRLARACAKAGRGGLEWFVGIPGSVGGAVCMNAGGHGSDTSEWIIDAEIADVSGAVRTWTAADLELSYRKSAITSRDIVLGARFRSVARPTAEAEAMLRRITQWRKDHQPGGTFNAGSVFKNPPGDAAGRLIDSIGLKGFRVGGAEVSARHANFFVASDDAAAQDVFDLMNQVRRRVAEETGILLEPEIRFAGRFRPTSGAESEGRVG